MQQGLPVPVHVLSQSLACSNHGRAPGVFRFLRLPATRDFFTGRDVLEFVLGVFAVYRLFESVMLVLIEASVETVFGVATGLSIVLLALLCRTNTQLCQFTVSKFPSADGAAADEKGKGDAPAAAHSGRSINNPARPSSRRPSPVSLRRFVNVEEVAPQLAPTPNGQTKRVAKSPARRATPKSGAKGKHVDAADKVNDEEAAEEIADAPALAPTPSGRANRAAKTPAAPRSVAKGMQLKSPARSPVRTRARTPRADK